jgi:regulator of sirC expression with transglutaminase-like and TPR domain
VSPDLARAGFAAAVAAPEIRLDVACAWIAAEENAALDPTAPLAELDTIAAGISVPEPTADRPDVERVARLCVGLFGDLGFTGDAEKYDDPENSLLDRVLARRRGMPILLAVVLLEVARRRGVPLVGIGFPGHFLVATATDPPVVLDPFGGGRVVSRATLEARLAQIDGATPSRSRLAEALAPVGPRYVLARVNNNLKGSWLRRGQIPSALRAVERLLLVAPDLVEELRDRGLMRLHLGEQDAGLADLARYLELWPDAPDRERIAGRIRQGRG